MCTEVGARLCTAVELQNDVARDTGCGLDMEQVWSNEPCISKEYGSNGYWLVGGSKQSNHAPQCKGRGAFSNVRCCADVETIGDSTAAAVVDAHAATAPVSVHVTTVDAVSTPASPAVSIHHGNEIASGGVSCTGFCGHGTHVFLDQGAVTFCQCDFECESRNDCCADFVDICYPSTTATAPAMSSPLKTTSMAATQLTDPDLELQRMLLNPACTSTLVLDSSEAPSLTVHVSQGWLAKRKASHVVGGSFLMATAKAGVHQTVHFTPRFLEAGLYKLYFAFRASTTRVSNLRLQVMSVVGTNTIYLNQQLRSGPTDDTGLYQLIGEYEFDKSTAGHQGVLIDTFGADIGQKVVVDAIKLVPVCASSAPAVPAQLPGQAGVNPASANIMQGLGGQVSGQPDPALPSTPETASTSVADILVPLGLILVVVVVIAAISLNIVNPGRQSQRMRTSKLLKVPAINVTEFDTGRDIDDMRVESPVLMDWDNWDRRDNPGAARKNILSEHNTNGTASTGTVLHSSSTGSSDGSPTTIGPGDQHQNQDRGVFSTVVFSTGSEPRSTFDVAYSDERIISLQNMNADKLQELERAVTLI